MIGFVRGQEEIMERHPKRFTVTDGTLTLTLEVAEESGFVVTSPSHPGLVTEAESVEEAFVMARDALACLLVARG